MLQPVKIFILLSICTFFAQPSSALTTKEFFLICKQAESQDCADVPVLQAYIGGSLDLLASLTEKTAYLSKIYCKEPQAIFDVGKVIAYMEEHQKAYLSTNAMLPVIRYFEENGGCNDEN